MDSSKKTKISKSLSYYLRHHLDLLKCSVSSDGYVPLSALLAMKSFKGVTVADVEEVVRDCPKQRFSLKKDVIPDGEFLIRANQGHSTTTVTQFQLNPEELFESIESPLPYCAHGTTSSVLPLILTEGLNKMSRSHIHLISRPDAKSGYRSRSDVLIHIDMEAAMLDGIRFYRADNDVILTEGINGVLVPKYIRQVENLR